MSPRAAALAGLAAVIAAAGGVAAGQRAGADDGRPAEAAVRQIGPTDAGSPIDFALTLRLDDQRLDHFLAAQQDPASDAYGLRLSPRAFGERFGPARSDLAGVRRRLEAAGLAVTRAYPQRTSLAVRGTAAEVRSLFGVELNDFAGGDGDRWHAPSGPVVVPGALRPAVRGVVGLDSSPRPIRSAAAPAEGMTGKELELAYGIKALHDAGFNGEGQTIAIMGYEAFNESDVAAYDEMQGISPPPVERVNVGGRAAEPEGEIHLDIDVVHAVAPKAQVLSYEAPFNVSMGQVVDQIVADGRTDIVSLSWGRCDLAENFIPSEREADLQAFKAAAAAGISFFNASGDAGAYDCQHANVNNDAVAVDFPSSSPDVVTVGGTRLFVRDSGQYLEEAGWEDVLSNSGGGGGLARDLPRPEYQQAPGVDNADSNGMRQVPDVAATADGDSGYLVVHNGEAFPVGGTSGAAPFWAANMLLIREYVAAKGGPEGLGFVNPMLYEIAREEGSRSPFNDVVKGGNRLHDAGPGWDYSTGLGSADMFELAQAFAERLRR